MQASLHSLRRVVALVVLLAAGPPLGAVPLKFLAWDDSVAARKIGFKDGENVSELQNLHPHKRSKAVSWSNGEAAPTLVALDRTSADGKPVTTPIKLASGMNAPLVLILPDQSAPSGLRCHTIDDSPGSFRWGTLRFLNATGREILVRQDKVIKALPETWKPIDIRPGGAKRNIGIQMASREDLSSVLYSSVWEHDPEVRKLIIVVPGTNASDGVLDLKIIPEDKRSAAAPPPEAP